MRRDVLAVVKRAFNVPRAQVTREAFVSSCSHLYSVKDEDVTDILGIALAGFLIYDAIAVEDLVRLGDLFQYLDAASQGLERESFTELQRAEIEECADEKQRALTHLSLEQANAVWQWLSYFKRHGPNAFRENMLDAALCFWKERMDS